MHLCYVISCDQDTTYADIACISIDCARIVHPGVKVSILTDAVSMQALKTAKSRLLELANHHVVVSCPHESMVVRSRFIKTSCRAHIQGDFLLIDADALPVRSLEAIFKLDCDIAIALDNNDPPHKQQIKPWIASIYEKMGWTYDVPCYYNSGVMLFRDTPKAHETCSLWHERWLATLAAGVDRDQPSLNSCFPVVRPKLHVLDPRYNAMVYHHVQSARDAAILHFWLSKSMSDEFMLSKLFHAMRHPEASQGRDTSYDKMLRRFVRTRYAWTDPYYVSALWHSGRYAALPAAIAVKLMRRIWPNFARKA